ncbi:MAG TPA: hypothetical protein VNG12_00095 [Acidimicrobiales bacterium]|nr:hypothetical protein [Acidimicrobiales bacterium]
MPIRYVSEREVRRHGKRYTQRTTYTTTNTLPAVVAAVSKLETVLRQRPRLSPFDVRTAAWEKLRAKAVAQLIDVAAIAEQCEDLDTFDRRTICDAAVKAVETNSPNALRRIAEQVLPLHPDDESVAERAAEQRKRAAAMYAVTATIIQSGGRMA